MTDRVHAPTRHDGTVVSGLGMEPMKQHRFVLDYDNAALAVASLTATGIDFDPDNLIPANALIMDWSYNVLDPFVGTGITAITSDMGDAVDPNELIDGADLETAGFSRGSRGTYSRPGDEPAYAPLGAVVATGANLDQLTAGRVEYTIHYFAPTDPRA